MVYKHFILPFNRKHPKIRLAFFSDTHNGNIQFARKQFRAWINEYKGDKYTWFIGNGDHIEAIGPFDPRFTLDHIDPSHRGKAALIDLQIKDFCQELEPIKSQVLALGMGNHEYEILRRHGSDPTERICETLGVTNIGYSCLSAITLRAEGQHGGSRIIKLYTHHGWGGGTRTLGGDMTKVSRKPAEFMADIYVFGHSHQGWEHPKTRVDITSTGKRFDRDYLMLNSGTFKKTLSESAVPSYEEKFGFPPQQLGGKVVEITVDTHKWVNMRTIS